MIWDLEILFVFQIIFLITGLLYVIHLNSWFHSFVSIFQYELYELCTFERRNIDELCVSSCWVMSSEFPYLYYYPRVESMGNRLFSQHRNKYLLIVSFQVRRVINLKKPYYVRNTLITVLSCVHDKYFNNTTLTITLRLHSQRILKIFR